MTNIKLQIFVALIGLLGAIISALIPQLGLKVSFAFFIGCILTLLIVVYFFKPGDELSSRSNKKFDRYILVYRGYPGDWKHVFSLVSTTGSPCGTNIEDAKKAKKVTIIGSNQGITNADENSIRNAGCKVERLDGKLPIDTKILIDKTVNQGGEFVGGTERQGWS